MQLRLPIILCCLLAALFWGCTKPYEPPEIQADYRLLVVDGFINADGISRISLSRTRKLSDSVLLHPEGSAQLQIEAESGALFPLSEEGGGLYISQPLQLNRTDKYALRIQTADGKRYRSLFVPVITAPPIDSLSWEQEGDISIYVSAHDPRNATRYYRWTFTETWEYHSAFTSHLGWENGQMIFRDPADYQHDCWHTRNSTDINTGSTIQLQQDVVNRKLVTTLPQGSSKPEIRYSILVQQYALTRAAFDFWQILQRNTQNLGSLFDAQPAQLQGNIFNTDDAREPVVGFVSAGTAAEKRLFINRSELVNWQSQGGGNDCTVFIVQPHEIANYLNDPTNAPAYFITGGGLAIAKKPCVDCTVLGGTNKKPNFW